MDKKKKKKAVAFKSTSVNKYKKITLPGKKNTHCLVYYY